MTCFFLLDNFVSFSITEPLRHLFIFWVIWCFQTSYKIINFKYFNHTRADSQNINAISCNWINNDRIYTECSMFTLFSKENIFYFILKRKPVQIGIDSNCVDKKFEYKCIRTESSRIVSGEISLSCTIHFQNYSNDIESTQILCRIKYHRRIFGYNRIPLWT